MSVRYEFGFGLSYTDFTLSNISVAKVAGETVTALAPVQNIVPGGNPTLWATLYTVTVNLTNVGAVSGATVPQLYVTLPSSAPSTPPKQLRGFEKVFLDVGASNVVNFDLMRRDLSYWDVVSQEWTIPTGEFRLSVGFSSRDIKLTTTLSVL